MANLVINSLYPFFAKDTGLWGLVIELPMESPYAKCDFIIDAAVFAETAAWRTIAQHGDHLGKGHHDGRVFFSHTAGSTKELPRLASFSAPREALNITDNHIEVVNQYESRDLESIIARKKTFKRPSIEDDFKAKIMAIMGG